MNDTRSQRYCRPVSVMAQLSVRRGREAVEFYRQAFGAVEDYRVGGTDENPAVVSQLSVGEATFWVADESPEHLNFSPESLGGGTTKLLLIVDDPTPRWPARSLRVPPRCVRPLTSTAGGSVGSQTRSATTGRSASRSVRGRRPADPESAACYRVWPFLVSGSAC
jgi:hypothetical protein